jgi:2,4-dienoyl-CoA reductase-like NADH-dependent reductase (Old Yellow Enzyme family)/thioredoxin reductase
MALDHILSPISIKGVGIKNRVVRTAHGTNLGNGTLNDDLIMYHEARAKGGVGLSLLEAAGVHPSGPGTLNVWGDEIVERYKKLMETVRPHGMRVFQQLQHLGFATLPIDGSPPWSASVMDGPLGRTIAMTKAQIREVVDAFAAAAVRAQQGGLDGIEIHCAHTFLLQQFLSPLTNRRDDEYGGSLDNRLRFAVEVMRSVRQAVGGDFVVGARFSPEMVPGGMTPDDVRDVVLAVEALGLVDYINLSHGSAFASHKIIGGMHEPCGYEIPASRVSTRAVRLPTIVTGRFRRLEEADAVIAAGEADMVGMTRAHIADPDIVRKTMEGRAGQIRPCIACNQGCVGGLEQGRMGCTVNVAVGAEHTLGDDRIQPAQSRRLVLVVGGGPAGMEAARAAALRGHRVILAEAKDRLGGTLSIARLAPCHALIGDIADWLAREIARLGVEIRAGVTIDAAYVAALNPDAVVVATGATIPQEIGAHRCDGVPLLSVEAVLTDAVLPGDQALVIDELGTYHAIAAAEALIERGATVTYVTDRPVFVEKVVTSLAAAPALERLAKGKFTLATRTSVVGYEDGLVTLKQIDTGAAQQIRADFAVHVRALEPDNRLAQSLAGFEVHIVGDAAGQRFLPTAIREGNAAGRCL